MPPVALALTLLSAVIHASWNMLLAREEDSQSAAACALLVGTVACLPLAFLGGSVEAAALPWAAASAGAEAVYFTLLARAYDSGRLSIVYPLARGTAPLIVLAVGAAALGQHIGLQAAAGVVVIVAGVLLVRGVRGASLGPELAMPLAVAGCIATYTLIDQHGLRYADPLPYLELKLAPAAAVAVLLVRRRHGPGAVRAALNRSTALAGIGVFSAFGLVLAALTRAPAAEVAAVRETGVVVAVFLGWRVLGEPAGRRALLGAALVAVGIGAIATS